MDITAFRERFVIDVERDAVFLRSGRFAVFLDFAQPRQVPVEPWFWWERLGPKGKRAAHGRLGPVYWAAEVNTTDGRSPLSPTNAALEG